MSRSSRAGGRWWWGQVDDTARADPLHTHYTCIVSPSPLAACAARAQPRGQACCPVPGPRHGASARARCRGGGGGNRPRSSKVALRGLRHRHLPYAVWLQPRTHPHSLSHLLTSEASDTSDASLANDTAWRSREDGTPPAAAPAPPPPPPSPSAPDWMLLTPLPQRSRRPAAAAAAASVVGARGGRGAACGCGCAAPASVRPRTWHVIGGSSSVWLTWGGTHSHADDDGSCRAHTRARSHPKATRRRHTHLRCGCWAEAGHQQAVKLNLQLLQLLQAGRITHQRQQRLHRASCV